jgi:hypothetical protein
MVALSLINPNCQYTISSGLSCIFNSPFGLVVITSQVNQ